MSREQLASSALPGYAPEVGDALWRLEDGRNRTLNLLNEAGDEHLDVPVNDNSIGTILYHLALIETDWLYAEILEQPYPEDLKALLPVDDRDEQGLLTAVRGQSLSEHLARLAAVRRALMAGLQGMTNHEFQRARNLPAYDVTPSWVLHHLAQHEAEHRGEIGAILTTIDRAPRT